MENTDVFEPITDQFTEVYDAQGGLIDRLNGHVQITAKDYDEFMPIEYRHITITTQVTSVVKIEKGGENA